MCNGLVSSSIRCEAAEGAALLLRGGVSAGTCVWVCVQTGRQAVQCSSCGCFGLGPAPGAGNKQCVVCWRHCAGSVICSSSVVGPDSVGPGCCFAVRVCVWLWLWLCSACSESGHSNARQAHCDSEVHSPQHKKLPQHKAAATNIPQHTHTAKSNTTDTAQETRALHGHRLANAAAAERTSCQGAAAVRQHPCTSATAP